MPNCGTDGVTGEYPTEQGIFWFWPESEPDSYERQHWTLTWFDGRNRGQCFFGTMQGHIDRLTEDGHTVEVMTKGNSHA